MVKKEVLQRGVFIDASNMWWAVKRMPEESRWYIDYRKFKDYLQQNYNPVFYRFYNIVNEQPQTEYHAQIEAKKVRFHRRLENMGYNVITKPLKHIKTEDGENHTKGDMDVEICLDVLDAMGEIDVIILCSGDSDYLPLIQQCHSRGKYIRLFSFKQQFAWELRQFAIRQPRCGYTLMDDIRDKISRAS